MRSIAAIALLGAVPMGFACQHHGHQGHGSNATFAACEHHGHQGHHGNNHTVPIGTGVPARTTLQTIAVPTITGAAGNVVSAPVLADSKSTKSAKSSKASKSSKAAKSSKATTGSTASAAIKTAGSATNGTSAAVTNAPAATVGAASGGGVTSVSVGSAPASCTVTAYASLSAALGSCNDLVIGDMSVPASSTLALTALPSGGSVTFAGKLTMGTTANSDFDPIVIEGDNVVITGTDGHSIDGNGQAYWDGQGSNGGSDKPDHFIVVKDSTNMVIQNLNIQNWPTHCFYISGNTGLVIQNLVLDNSAGDQPNDASGSDPAAHNSDGFDISSSDSVTLSGIKVYNQDDCVAVTSGSNILVDSMYCSGGHGLSIGSIGGKSNNTVSGVTFSNSQIVNSENGCRIKTNADADSGSVTNIIYQNITMSGITDYGIDVQQDYENGGATGSPGNSIDITGISFIDVTGTMSDGTPYYVLCGDGSCSDFTFTGVSITGGSGSSCNFPDTGCPS